MKNHDISSPKITRDRPAIFRAMGLAEPPALVQIKSSSDFDGEYQRVQVFKHDSWAATALYACDARAIVCKFNRQQRIGVIPMRWLGNFLARRETLLLQKLKHITNIPNSVGPILVEGQTLENVTAHVYVPGRPFKHDANASDAFLAELEQLIGQVHAADVAYVDLHKSENILVGDDGKPYLIDFQIGFWKPSSKVAAFFCNSFLLALQRSDRYHLLKHITKCRTSMDWNQMHLQRPWYIRLHRRVAIPLRTMRRRFLVLLGIRTGIGHVSTESNPEIGHRMPVN